MAKNIPLPDAVASINAAVEGMLSDRLEEAKDVVKIASLKSVKVHINALPDYAAAYVWKVLEIVSKESHSKGIQSMRHRHVGYSDEDFSRVDMKSLFDAEVIQ